VFREREEAHLVAAFNYSLHWLHNKPSFDEDGELGRFSVYLNGFIETMADPEDHFEVVEKGKEGPITIGMGQIVHCHN
jgi:hypothetical protein